MNRVALITGSSRGMGEVEAYEFAKKGYDVIVHCVKSIDKTGRSCKTGCFFGKR